MVISNDEKLIADIKEVVNLFVNEKDFFIEHNFCVNFDKISNSVTISPITVSSNATKTEYFYEFDYKNSVDELENKRIKKRYAKLAVYKALSEFLKKTLPWGALTGIRPTKLAYTEKESGRDFKKLFKSTFLVSDEKIELIDKIISSQQGVYKKDDDAYDFFVEIPFCPTRCKYCSFITADMRSTAKLIPLYLDALVKEINESKKLVKNLRSVYIGGGTPVALSSSELERVLKAIDYKGVEYTVEAGRPDCITEENLKILKDYGVTRICVNPQTFSDKTLINIGRNHTAKDIFDKYNLAKKYGFDINMDFIAGLPGEDFSDFKNSIDTAISLCPENITVHTLCLKKGSALKEETDRLDGGLVPKMVEYAHGVLQKFGYNPYYLYRQKYTAGNLENTGYAKDGKACVYNIGIMEEISSNVACGAHSISKKVYNGGERIERYASPKDISTYINKVDEIIKKKEELFEE